MKKIFNFSRGEFWATVVLLLLILGGLFFSFFYEKRLPEKIDLSEYRATIQEFEEQQQFFDSTKHHQKKSFYKRSYRYDYDYTSTNKKYDSAHYQRDTSKLQRMEKKVLYQIHKIDLNKCDTTAIVGVPQFGSKRALKVIEYRDKLGGFYSFAQLREIYILQDISIEHCAKYFTIDPSKIKKIDINHVTYKELITHPYFDAYLTKQVINYRDQKGSIKNMAHFKEITHAYKELTDKLEPYLIFE